jgi:hypothetical protein
MPNFQQNFFIQALMIFIFEGRVFFRVVDPDPYPDPDPDWIRIQWGVWIRNRIRIRNPDPHPDPGAKKRRQ